MGTITKKIDELAKWSAKDFSKAIKDGYQDVEFSTGEVASWEKSLPALVKVVSDAGLGNLYLTMEYELLSTKRVDAVLTGRSPKGESTCLLIELKQWSKDHVMLDDQEFNRFIISGGEEPYYSLHPLEQVEVYQEDLKHSHENIHGGRLACESCVYMLNFDVSGKDSLFQNYFSKFDKQRLFCKGEESSFVEYLQDTFSHDDASDAMKLFTEGHQVFTDIDMEAITKIDKDPDNISLIQDQLPINDMVCSLLDLLLEGNLKKKCLICISGAAGTGKTILGFHLMAEYGKRMREAGRECSGTYAYAMPRSRTVFAVLEELTRSGEGIPPAYLDRVQENLNLLVIDEAHRITSLDGVTKGKILSSSIVVVLQDDRQRVLGNEIGTVDAFHDFAASNNMEWHHETLTYQKRNGTGNYVERVDNLLFDDPLPDSRPCRYNVNICDSLREMENVVNDLHSKDKSIKYYAPYCWEWRTKNTNAPATTYDIEINDPDGYAFQKKWNPKYNQYAWYLDSIDKVGCIYTAQGLGFDYVALIWWDDLRWDPQKKQWICDFSKLDNDTYLIRSRSHRKNDDYLIKDIYRVLLTRAKKGLYIWFKDEATKQHFKDVVLGK